METRVSSILQFIVSPRKCLKLLEIARKYLKEEDAVSNGRKFLMFCTCFRQSSSGQGNSVQGKNTIGMSCSQDNKINLPPLPSGVIYLNALFLNADASPCPYRVDHLHGGIEAARVFSEVLRVGRH